MKMPDDFDSGDWVEYKRLVIDGLRDVKKDMKSFRESVDTRLLAMSTEIAGLKVEVKHSAGKWALISGAIAAIGVSLFARFVLSN